MVNSIEKLLTGIIFCTEPQPVTGNRWLKYRNIKNSPQALHSFETFAKQFPGAHYINYYEKKSRQYCGRVYLSHPKK